MIDTLNSLLLAPLNDYGFMRRALIAGLALSLAAPPLGVFLMLRGMSLIGDAMSHAILPGVALGFLMAGFSLPIMSLGGMLSGLLIALLAGSVRRYRAWYTSSAVTYSSHAYQDTFLATATSWACFR